MSIIGEIAIRAGDFAGFVPASRGGPLPPPAPQASLTLLPGNRNVTDPRTDRRPGGLSTSIARNRRRGCNRCRRSRPPRAGTQESH